MVAIPNNQVPDLENQVQDLLEAVTGLKAPGKITAQVRKNIDDALGERARTLLPENEGKKKNIEPDITPEIMDRVFSAMVENHAKIFALIKVEKPREQKLTVSVNGKNEIKDLVRDPTSRESQALVWLVNNVIAPGGAISPAMQAKLDEFFTQLKVDELKLVPQLEKARSIVQRIDAEPDYLMIGDAKSAGTRLGDMQQEIVDHDNDIKANIGNKKFDPKPLRERQKDLRSEISTLQNKRRLLQKELASLHQSLNGFPNLKKPDFALLSGDLSPDFLDEYFDPAETLTIGGTTRTSQEWLKSDEVPAELQSIRAKASLQGTGQPSARAVLDGVIGEQFGASLVMATDQQKQAHTDYIRTMLTQDMVHAAVTNPVPPTAAPAAPVSSPVAATSPAATNQPQSAGSSPFGWITKGAKKIWNIRF